MTAHVPECDPAAECEACMVRAEARRSDDVATLREALRAAEAARDEYRAALGVASANVAAVCAALRQAQADIALAREERNDQYKQRVSLVRDVTEEASRAVGTADMARPMESVRAVCAALRQAQAERDAAREREARLVAAFDAYAESGSSAQLRDLRAVVDAARVPTHTTDAEEADRGPDATPAEETGR